MDPDGTGLRGRDERLRAHLDGHRSPAPDWDGLADALREVIEAAIPLLRADGVGLMLADRGASCAG